jgi:hypothetical protein
MSDQLQHAETQHDLCCSLLGINPSFDAPGSTLYDAVSELIKLREELQAQLAVASQLGDQALKDAVAQGIAMTPDRTLTDEVLAAIRLPVSAKHFGKICQAFPEDARCDQYGPWFRIIKPQ